MLDVVNLTSKILTYYDDTVGITEYINILGGAKKNSYQAQLLILDVTLMAIVTKYIPYYQAFTPKMKELEKNHPVDKTWVIWKLTFLEAHEYLQRYI